jgi:hypothetical protein
LRIAVELIVPELLVAFAQPLGEFAELLPGGGESLDGVGGDCFVAVKFTEPTRAVDWIVKSR